MNKTYPTYGIEHMYPLHPNEEYLHLSKEVAHIDWDQPEEDLYGRECQAKLRSLGQHFEHLAHARKLRETEGYCPICGTEDTGRYDHKLDTELCVDCIDANWLERLGNYYRTEEVVYQGDGTGVRAYSAKASCPTGISASISWDHPPCENTHAPSSRERKVAIDVVLTAARATADRQHTTPYR